VASSSRDNASLVSRATHCARARYGAGIIPARSVSSAKFSAEHLKESQTLAGSSTVTAKIFPLILKVRSPQVTCSVAWGEGEAEIANPVDVCAHRRECRGNCDRWEDFEDDGGCG
jgi:hypothetical protein